MDEVGILKALVAIDSQTSKDNTPLIKKLEEWFSSYETTVQKWQKEDGTKGTNLVVKIPGARSDQATVFVCHTDTVPTSSKWVTDPFTLTEKEANLYGLGACDTKGGIASLIEAVLSFKEKPARDTYIVFDGDEENTSVGITAFLKEENIQNPQFIAIEPTDGNVLIAERSVVKFRITTHGVSQHSSKATPELNDRDNAIHKMAKIMMALEKDAEKLAEEKDPLLGTHTQNFGVITGGTAHNVVPDTCVLTMHRRLLPQRDSTKEKEYLEKLLAPIDSTVTIELIGDPEPGFKLTESSSFAHSVLTCVQKELSQATFAAFLAWSESGLTSKKGESVILGPGSIHQAHNANEFVSKKELVQFVSIFQHILQTLVL